MFPFLLTLCVLYLAVSAWPKLVSKRDGFNWLWPVALVVRGWNKMFGADSIFDKKD